MKLIILSQSILLTVMLLNTGCSSMANSNDENLKADASKIAELSNSVSDDVQQAITLATENKDYRLLATSGRNTSIPGIKSTEYQMAIELCGKKHNPITGDVITSEDQRSARKKEINFMRQYNEQMLTICRERNVNKNNYNRH